LDMRVEAL